jgi:hypothetical protein
MVSLIDDYPNTLIDEKPDEKQRSGSLRDVA